MYFLTGNKGKVEEVKEMLPEVEQLDVDVPEIQSLDAQVVIKAKIEAARHHVSDAELIVEDTSLYFDCLKGLPGPLMKWFLKTIGNDGLWKIVQTFGNDKAEAKVVIGYADTKGNVRFFEGAQKGKIVAPRGSLGFGWDPIFIPEGHEKTFGEMTMEEKNGISMRKIALSKLEEFRKKEKM